MMSARLVMILIILFIGIGFYGSTYAGYRYYKKNYGEWTQEKAKLRKMSWLEISLSGGAILIASVIGLVRYFIGYGIDFLSVGSLVLVILVITLNIVIKRGGSVAVLMFVMVTALYIFLTGMIIGIPQTAPVFTVNNTEIKLAHTTAEDLINDGFDIYIRYDENSHADYSEESFKKYSADRSIYVEKGFRRNDTAVEYSPYLLVKDGVVIGAIGFYGDENNDIILEDCKIIHIRLNEDCIKAIRENSINCKLNGLDLIAPLEPKEVEETFGSKLWLAPGKRSDTTDRQYAVRWPASNDSVEYLFWNTYYSSISFDEHNKMIQFELSTNMAMDTSF